MWNVQADTLHHCDGVEYFLVPAADIVDNLVTLGRIPKHCLGIRRFH
jgi:hypothetical protein